MRGICAVLNVGMGDTKLSFDPASPADRKHAAAAVADMLRRGFAILVQVGEADGKPLYQRIDSFDAARCEYVIVGLPADLETGAAAAPPDPPPPGPAAPKPRPGRKAAAKALPRTRIPAEKANAVAIGRSAGG